MDYIAHYDARTGRTQTVEVHLAETAQLAAKFASKIGLGTCGWVVGLLHDLGKYSDLFQKRIKENGEICDHSTAGAQVLFDKLDNSEIATILALCIFAHHGGLFDMLEITEGSSKFHSRLQKMISSKEVVCERGQEQLDALDKVKKDLFVEVNKLWQNLNLLNPEGSREYLLFQALITKFLYSCLIDADRLNTIRFLNGDYDIPKVAWIELADALDKQVASFEVNPLNEVRKQIYNSCKYLGSEAQSIYKLSVSTGAGKTLASLRFAIEQAREHKLDRIIYVLPYTSIIEQNAEVVREILKQNGIDVHILLESHSNIDSSSKDDYINIGLTSNWDAQIIFTTVVSFYESVFAGGTKHIRRFHNMAKSVIIFDEVQALPIKLIHMSNMLLRFLYEVCGSTILLCSATQPLFDRIQNEMRRLPAPKDIISTKFSVLDRVNIIDRRCKAGYSHRQIAQMVFSELNTVNNVLIVVNTRTEALDLYNELRTGGYKVFHLSTYMCAAHRSDVIAQIKAALDTNEKIICVSTQLIEAGVNLDFACVFRTVAGLDSIIQCAGRCNREGKLRDSAGNLIKGNVYIINSATENIESLNDIRIGQEVVERVLRDCNGDVLSDAAIELYYKYYFYERQTEMAYPVKAKDVGIDTDLFELFSKNQVSLRQYMRENKENFPYKLSQAFGTVGKHFKVIKDVQIGIIVPYGEGKNIIANLHNMSATELYKKVQRYTVNVYPEQLKGLSVNYINGVGFVKECDYDEIVGLKMF